MVGYMHNTNTPYIANPPTVSRCSVCLPVSGLAAVKRAEVVGLLAEDIPLVDNLVLAHGLLPVWEDDAWLPADGGDDAQTTAEQLVATTCPNQLEIQGEVKQARLVGLEHQLQLSLSTGWDYPAKLD